MPIVYSTHAKFWNYLDKSGSAQWKGDDNSVEEVVYSAEAMVDAQIVTEENQAIWEPGRQRCVTDGTWKVNNLHRFVK